MRLFMGAIKCAGCLQIVFTGGIAFVVGRLDVCLTGWRHPLSYRMPPARAKKRYIQTLAKEMRRLCFKALTIKLSARAGWHRSACTLQKHRKRWGRKFSKMSSVVVKSLNVSFFFSFIEGVYVVVAERALTGTSVFIQERTPTPSIPLISMTICWSALARDCGHRVGYILAIPTWASQTLWRLLVLPSSSAALHRF